MFHVEKTKIADILPYTLGHTKELHSIPERQFTNPNNFLAQFEHKLLPTPISLHGINPKKPAHDPGKYLINSVSKVSVLQGTNLTRFYNFYFSSTYAFSLAMSNSLFISLRTPWGNSTHFQSCLIINTFI